MTSRSAVAAAIGISLVAFASSHDARAQAVVAGLVDAADPEPFSPDDLLFMEVTADGHQLAETLNVYSSRSGVFVPLGEFSRVIDFAVGVFPSQGRAEGWVGSRDRDLRIDLAQRRAVVGTRVITFETAQAAIYDDDLYLRLDLIEQLLPVKLRADVSAQTLTVAPTEPLPFQQRLAREQRAAGLETPASTARVLVVPADYALFTPPSFDVNLGGQIARDGSDQTRSYDLRLAGDLLYAGFQGFVGSDQDGELDDVRVLFERKDPAGRALGPLGGTRAGIGDVFTPSMSIGAGSFGGRGLYYTSAPLEALDLSTPLDLRGELPLGEDVELYVNEVLQATQASATQGRYEFLDVPLTYGLNTIRLVFYGSQGQTREEVRRVNFGTGQVAAGRLVLRLGAVQQNTPAIGVGEPVEDSSVGEPRVAAILDFGLSPTVTLSGGVARYTPQGVAARSVGLFGARASLGGLAAQLDIAADSEGGSGATIGMAARPYGISLLGRHSEYRGGFVDETRQPGQGGAALTRSTDLRIDAQWQVAPTLSLPLSVDMRRLERNDDTDLFTAELRTSAPLNRYYVSTALAYENEKTVEGRRDRLVGSLDVATLLVARAQLRAGITYEAWPEGGLDTAYANVDYQLDERRALRLGIVRTFDSAATAFQASTLFRAARFDVALNANYEVERGDWQIGLQFGFGLAFNPFTRGYRVTRPGASSGGSVALNAYIDSNGDGRRQTDEAPVPNVVLDTPAGAAVTGVDGQVLAGSLGDGGAARLRVNLEGLEDPFLVGAADVVETVPRPGRVAVVDYPLQATSEIELTARLRRNGATRSLAAVNLRLAPVDGGEPVAARTDHAGIAFVEGVRPGRYRVTLDPQQARDLGLVLEGETELLVPAAGGFVRGGDIFVLVDEKETAR